MIWAFLRLELSIAKRYKFRLVSDMLSLFMTLALFFYLSKSLGPTKTFQGEYFPYLLIGVLFNRFYQTISTSSVSMLTDFQYLGVLEPILAGQKNKWRILLAAGFPMIFRDFITTILTLLLCMVLFDFSFSFESSNLLILSISLVLLAIFSIGLSLISLGSILRYKRINLVTYLTSIGTSLLTGVYFPLSVFPEWLQKVCHMIPLTHALKLVRYGIGAPIEQTNISNSLIILSTFSLFSLCFGFYFYFTMEKQVLKRGSLLGI